MEKIYTRQSKDGCSILEIAKWLRGSGVLNQDFEFVQLNYQQIQVKFRNSQLELAYILKYEWSKSSNQ